MVEIEGMEDRRSLLARGIGGTQKVVVSEILPGQTYTSSSLPLVECIGCVSIEETPGVVRSPDSSYTAWLAARDALVGGARRVSEVGMRRMNQLVSRGLQDGALASCLYTCQLEFGWECWSY